MSNRDAMKTMPPTASIYKVKRSYEWINTWRYVIVQPSVKSVGLAAATFASADGTSVRPGVRRLMTITGYSNRAVCDALTTLRWLGFLWRAKQGTRTPEGGQADDHWLCIPRDLSHIPIADFQTGLEPRFVDLTPQAQRVAAILGVDKRLRKIPSELSAGSSEVTSPGDVTSVHNTNTVTNSIDHSVRQQTASRASARGVESLDDYDLIDEAVGGLDPVESSTADGMLSDGKNVRYIINTILKRREEAA